MATEVVSMEVVGPKDSAVSSAAPAASAMSESVKKAKGAHRKRNYASYSTFIHRISKDVVKVEAIGKNTVAAMQSMINETVKKICKEANTLLLASSIKTLNVKTLKVATELCMPENLAKDLISAGDKAVETFASTPQAKGENTTKSKRAGLTLPSGRIMDYMRKHCAVPRITSQSPIFMTGVLESLLVTVLQEGQKDADKNKKQRLTPRHIEFGIAGDVDLSKVFEGVNIMNAGVIPQIQPELLQRKKKKKSLTSKRNVAKKTIEAAGEKKKKVASSAAGTAKKASSTKKTAPPAKKNAAAPSSAKKSTKSAEPKKKVSAPKKAAAKQ